MGVFVLYKVVNLVDRRDFYGIHETDDAFYGTPFATDVSMPHAAEIAGDIRKHGRKAFIIEAIHGFGDYQSAAVHLRRYIENAPKNSYHQRTEKNLGVAWSDERRKEQSQRIMGDKNPAYGKEQSLEQRTAHSEFRKNIIWVNNGFEERQLLKDDPIPEGWKRGRRPNLMARFRKTNHQV